MLTEESASFQPGRQKTEEVQCNGGQQWECPFEVSGHDLKDSLWCHLSQEAWLLGFAYNLDGPMKVPGTCRRIRGYEKLGAHERQKESQVLWDSRDSGIKGLEKSMTFENCQVRGTREIF